MSSELVSKIEEKWNCQAEAFGDLHVLWRDIVGDRAQALAVCKAVAINEASPIDADLKVTDNWLAKSVAQLADLPCLNVYQYTDLAVYNDPKSNSFKEL